MPRSSKGGGLKGDPDDNDNENGDVPQGQQQQQHRSPQKKRRRSRTGNSHHHHRHHHHHSRRDSKSGHAAAARPAERRGSGGRASAEAGAVAAAAAPRAEDPLLQELLDHFKAYLAADGSGNGSSSGAAASDDAHDSIDLEKARNVLDAAAGNVQLAAQLYWDDYFATAAANAAQQEAPPARKPGSIGGRGRRENRGSGNYSDDDKDDDDDDEAEGDEEPSPHRPIRRSLDREFGRAADPPDDSDDEGGDDMDEDGGNEDNGSDIAHHRVRAPRRRLARRQPLADGERPARRNRANLAAGSVSVSDDEAGGAGVWRIVGSMVAQLDEDDSSPGQRNSRGGRRVNAASVHQKIREAAAVAANEVLKDAKEDDDSRRSRTTEASDKGSDVDEDDYISDSDWLEEDAASVPALDLLWGGRGGQQPSSSSAGNSNGNGNGDGNVAESNVIADDDDADDEDQDGQPVSGIPHTWLKAAFNLSSCGTGLELKAPKLEDMELYVWRQQQNEGGRNNKNIVPPPYHCKAVSALLSVVTAMLYTGASIQGKEVNCTAARKPFLELSEDERKREFETRLTDALSALIFIAAKASTKRKERALRRAKAGKKYDDQKLKLMERKLRLIPTCRWRDDAVTSMQRQPEGPLFQQIDVVMSFTNINDIRAYVLSSMRTFMSHGGVALLLETILRIHGKSTVSRMVERARRDATTKAPEAANQNSLISCSCEEKKKKILEENPLPMSARNDTSQILDPTPGGHECMTVELMSLILTGRVHGTWKGWSTQGLQFGLLSTQPGVVGWQLARPEKPVWILRGHSCYSVAWLSNVDSLPSDISKLDRPATPMIFAHWNCWYGQRNKSRLRLNTAPAGYDPPTLSKKRAVEDDESGKRSRRRTTDLLLSRRQQKQTNVVSSDEHEAIEEREMKTQITEDEMEKAKPHPEDEKFYPGNHQMWRFDMGNEDTMDTHWVPYHRLSTRDKLIVERKLGPKIKTILWTRWPGSTIDNFEPSDGKYPIV